MLAVSECLRASSEMDARYVDEPRQREKMDPLSEGNTISLTDSDGTKRQA